ncbi:cell growth-regulating nucleolar protein [Zootermopsis nevadensis]|uniref:Cell growth-regulating nucleolar protein n=1 Tax=Zootermopsis nevadensis TaxID=136037 RepID=A0A067RJ01_ZOONE|nr:cell growth-regulating nucleolar protein [Zootermopsis nevadensis]XP_021917965.1 cell growth-regulating nucleolar protein [Zootermopsis nevadensis]KDR20425.1 Cell growth-regulating nucleolar protein [Zootermopsis nevadensis]
MVFFTCAHCGESLKKAKVEKHYQTVCSRNAVAVTCVDCCKDFSADTYPAHIKCVSEEEKYSAKGFVPRPSANKGERKQKKWQDIINSMQETQNSLSHDEQAILNVVVKHENVPRKKIKFQNFLRNCLKSHYNGRAADSFFDKMEALSKEEELNKEDDKKRAKINKEAEKENTNTVDVKENDDEPSQEEQVDEKLSKKERKERRKKAKYEAELKEIEGNHMSEADVENKDESRNKKKSKRVTSVSTENGNVELEEKSRKKHKGNVSGAENGVSEETEMSQGQISKKRKKESMTEDAISEDCVVKDRKKSKKKQKKEAGAIDNEDANRFEGGKSKKKRKKGQDEAEDICGEQSANKKLKTNDTEEEAIHTASGKTKFNLQEIIIKALESKDSKELPLKRLQKKVLAEYEAMGDGSAGDVKMIARFNKKVHKIPGVVVRKEVVKLLQ